MKRMLDGLFSIVPGLALCAAIGALARFLDLRVVPTQLFFVNHVLLAIFIGLVVRTTLGLPALLGPGIRFGATSCLYAGIVLMGAGLELGLVGHLGLRTVIMVAISITISIVACGWLGRRLGIGERWGHLVGAGIGVCGISAVMALAPAIRASRQEVATAIGALVLADITLLVGLPLVSHYLGWCDTLVGFLAGAVPTNTAQCVAIGHVFSQEAGVVATVVKSARNSLLPLVVLAVTYAYARRGSPVGERPGLKMLWSRFPRFVLGFVLLVGLSTAGLVPAPMVAVLRQASSGLFLICFAAIGLGIQVREFGRNDALVLALGVGMMLVLFGYARLFLSLVLGL